MNAVGPVHDEKWSRLFREEAEKIGDIFAGELISIHHIGSTSVPGVVGPSIIDLMPVVKHLDRIDLYNEQMERLGYACMGEHGTKGRRYFRKGMEYTTHQVHVFQADDKDNIERHLAVRNYLRAYFESVGQPASEKAGGHDRAVYLRAQEVFLRELVKRERCF